MPGSTLCNATEPALYAGRLAGEATLRGYIGHVESTGTFNGKRFTITFSSRSFRNRNWRCVEVHEPPLKPTTFT